MITLVSSHMSSPVVAVLVALVAGLSALIVHQHRVTARAVDAEELRCNLRTLAAIYGATPAQLARWSRAQCPFVNCGSAEELYEAGTAAIRGAEDGQFPLRLQHADDETCRCFATLLDAVAYGLYCKTTGRCALHT